MSPPLLSFNDDVFFVQVEVGPSSFLKVKMLGKGDVGRVYLVKEKKTDKLFAMKGMSDPISPLPVFHLRSQCSQRRR